MALPSTGAAQATGADTLLSVACPFCGILCDDLVVAPGAVPKVSANGCARSRALFFATADAAPSIDGASVPLEQAIARAAEILAKARQPLFLSAGTDVAGTRALLELAERAGGIVDHVNGDAVLRNLLVLQDTGWVSTTLTEVRNRCDLLVVAGSDVSSRFPRFFERCLDNRAALFHTGERDIVFLGTPPAGFASSHRVSVLEVAPTRLGELFAALRCLLTGRKLRAREVAGVPLDRLSALLDRMRAARYGVLTWAAADLDFPHAELAVQSMCELVQEINDTSRFAVLPLGGNQGDLTTTQVTTWQTGYPLRVSFGSGAPEFDPLHYSAERLLARGEADALLFVSAFDTDGAPPATEVPSIVLGRPGSAASRASVYIPVATPGLHHAGHLFRTDTVVAIRLRQVGVSEWPSAATALSRILENLGGRQ
jgi:formylmethanofuran dehydrogenase subunit B